MHATYYLVAYPLDLSCCAFLFQLTLSFYERTYDCQSLTCLYTPGFCDSSTLYYVCKGSKQFVLTEIVYLHEHLLLSKSSRSCVKPGQYIHARYYTIYTCLMTKLHIQLFQKGCPPKTLNLKL